MNKKQLFLIGTAIISLYILWNLMYGANESSTIDSKKMIILFVNSLCIGGMIGSIVGFHKGAKWGSNESFNRFEIFMSGIGGSIGGGILGVTYPISVPFYLIVDRYKKKYSR